MKKLLLIIIAIIIVGGGAFYGGMKYGQNKSSLSDFSRQNFQDLSPEQRQQLSQKKLGDREGLNLLNGEVIDKDEQSLTLKISDGGSKIVFFSDSTKVSKTTDGLINDIEIGKKITVSGEQNSDGIYTAEIIQLSPRVIQPGE